MFARELAAQSFAAVIYAAAKNGAVWPREIDMLKNTLLERFLRREMDGLESRLGDAQHFAGLDFAEVLRVEQIECAGFAGDDPGGFATGRGEFSEIQRAEAAWVAHGVKFIGSEDHQRVGT